MIRRYNSCERIFYLLFIGAFLVNHTILDETPKSNMLMYRNLDLYCCPISQNYNHNLEYLLK